MVKELTAYEASDGKLFASKLAAAKHDAVIQLGKLQVFNHASALAVVEHAQAVVDAIQPVLLEEEASHALDD